jgi:5-methylcytosine-specific restriction endonuclease McrA
MPQADKTEQAKKLNKMPVYLGRRTKDWLKFRRRWIRNHPPNHQGYYICYICESWIPAKEMTLDHVIPRSRDETRVFDESNLRPCCLTCNNKKGSKVND